MKEKEKNSLIEHRKLNKKLKERKNTLNLTINKYPKNSVNKIKQKKF